MPAGAGTGPARRGGGKLATDRICVTGQSMGGGGTLWAATDLGNMIRCAVSKYIIASYKVYLEDDMRYLDVLNAPPDKDLSQYMESN